MARSATSSETEKVIFGEEQRFIERSELKFFVQTLESAAKAELTVPA